MGARKLSLSRMLLGTALVAVTVIAACSFPDVGFSPVPLPGADGGPGTGDGSPTTDDASVDAPLQDAQTRSDATQIVDEAGCQDKCDCDRDGFQNSACFDASADSGTKLDCDDFDPLVFPGNPDFINEVPTGNNKGDWNCDGVVEPQYPTKLRCGCGSQGFKEAPGCGVKADYFACPAGLVCSAGKIDSRKQGCR